MYLVLWDHDCHVRVFSRHQQEWDAETIVMLLSQRYPHDAFFVTKQEG